MWLLRKATPTTLTISFCLGMLFGAYVQNLINKDDARYGEESAVFTVNSIRPTGVSHNPEIRKHVLAAQSEMPHITQVAKSIMKPGQIASENRHRDMVEMFIFVAGSGILKLGSTNHSVSRGSVSIIYPPTRHTIFNSGKSCHWGNSLFIAEEETYTPSKRRSIHYWTDFFC